MVLLTALDGTRKRGRCCFEENMEIFSMVDEATNPTVNSNLTEEAANTAETGKRGPAEAFREQAGKFGNDAADRARTFAGEGKDRATGALDEMAKLFESAAGEVDTKLGEQYGQYARTAAQGISNFSESLRNKDVDVLWKDASDFVKKSPVIAVGAAAAVGFVLARVLKSGIEAATSGNDAGSTDENSDEK